jgi:hypothetical protein
MTTIVDEDFDPGAADETTVTTGNTAFSDNPVIGANGAGIKFDTAQFHTGTKACRVDVGNPASFTVLIAANNAGGYAKAYCRFYVMFATIPASNSVFCSWAAGGVAQMQMRTTGQLAIRNNTTQVAISTMVLSPMTWYGIEWGVDSVADTQELRIYDSTFSDLRESISGAYTQAAVQKLQMGNVTGVPAGWQLWFDDVNVNDAVFPGPLGSPEPATGTGFRMPDGVGGYAKAKILLPPTDYVPV